jgi:thioredoxin-like negative regulator of GroEL
MVLAHELAHVFALELSRARAPRWLAEGLADWETTQLRPEWRRHDELDLAAALQANALPPLGRLSELFLRPRNVDDAVFAYGYADVAVGWLERKFGFGKLRQALVDYGRGVRGAAALERLSGMPLSTLEGQFRAALETELGSYLKQFLPESRGRRTLDAGSRPASTAQAMTALAAGDLKGARRLAPPPRAQGATPTPEERYLEAALALGEGRAGVAAERLDALVADGHDGYDVRVRRAMAAVALGDAEGVEAQLRRAIAFAPTRVEGHALLAEHLRTAARGPARLETLAAALRLDPQEAKLAKEAVREARRLHRWDLVAELAPISVFIDPADPDAPAALAEARAALGGGDAGAPGPVRASPGPPSRAPRGPPRP